ncbi:MAG TPA: hypothetical protein VE975_05540, partial [Actinomycetota bacterium]|nr:hypothetical protein [Actinomycetota bacterium]
PTPTTSPGAPGPVAAASCSAAGMDAALTPQPALPSEVQSVRDQIFNLALACDFEGLSDLARAPSGSFTYSFGGSNGDLAGYLKDADNHENALRVLVGLLDTPYVTPQDVYGPEYSGPQGYWWPSAFRSSPTDADWEALEGVIPAAELQAYRSSGSYVGRRLFITKDGDWQIFVTGD